MKHHMFSWNVRGLHDSDKRRVIKSFVRGKKSYMFSMQETKTSAMTIGIIRSFWVGRGLNWISQDARGTTGGVMMMWDFGVLECLGLRGGSLFYFLSLCEDGFDWVFSVTYGPLSGKERREMWEELISIRGLWEEPSCICKNFFFLIRNDEDYINIRTNTGEIKETREREKNQGKDERSFLHKLNKGENSQQ